MSLQVEGSLKRPPLTLALPKPTVMSLQGELGAYMEETVREETPRQQAVFEGGGRFKLSKSQSQEKIGIVLSPIALMGREPEKGRGRNFSKSQRLHEGRVG